MTSRQIRQSFLDFFAARGHRIVPSAPVIPHGDPTLLFTNAGMNQFKDVFLGVGKRDYTRVADTQKCIRVSGKHNDLEEVGYDTYHHTFFEMLGNWSFGDYYKEEAIGWSWELLTDVWKLPKERLPATVYQTDDEAYEIWKKYLPETHIHRFGDKDNFWEMGDSGPCGPCSEIHFDRTPDLSGGALVNLGVQEAIEIWNIVFIQYNRRVDGSLEDLTSKHVDTGMGFERVTAVIQEKASNYDTDVFQPIINVTVELSGKPYRTELDDQDGVAMRVIADHIRTLTFAIADGAIPGNEGRGYVLRRILRRAARYARNLGLTEPVLYKHVRVLCETMGDVFPEIVQQQALIERIIKAEEESFLATLDRGLVRFEDAAARAEGGMVQGADAFELYDTFGFPIDLTQLLARERNLQIDLDEYERLLNEQRSRSRAARKSHVAEVQMDSIDAVSRFDGYEHFENEAQILAIRDNQVVTDVTPFYVEMGGQVSDTGVLIVGGEEYIVEDVRKNGDAIVHLCETPVAAVVGDRAVVRINADRRKDIAREHSATHLLHESLRRVLGSHVQQAGSLVAPDHLRFDFSHFEKVRQDELEEIERMVNEKIFQSIDVRTEELSIEQARSIPGAKMFFGDKYGDKVRVVTIDENFSVEFCGGTHVRNTSEIGLMKLISETSVAAGVRRIDAIAGRSIPQYLRELAQQRETARDETLAVHDRVRQLEKELAGLRTQELAAAIPALVSAAQSLDGVAMAAGVVKAEDGEQLKTLGDELRLALKHNGIGVLAAELDGKVQLVCVVTDDLIPRYKAGTIVGAIAKELGGGGGGKPHLATAGGRDVARLADVMQRLPQIITQTLST
ncbi:alanine--tRNA ligase [soil metagenome]